MRPRTSEYGFSEAKDFRIILSRSVSHQENHFCSRPQYILLTRNPFCKRTLPITKAPDQAELQNYRIEELGRTTEVKKLKCPLCMYPFSQPAIQLLHSFLLNCNPHEDRDSLSHHYSLLNAVVSKYF